MYLPEEMLFVKFMPDGSVSGEKLSAGHHYVEIALNEVPLFVRKGKCIPVAKAAQSVEELDVRNLEILGYDGAEYELYEDDGIHKDYANPRNKRMIKK